ncbi:type I-B CRISPR-associated protein Cas7/Cst2/DevR [Aphanothece sacrum]|uniref:CRISPR-associated autoregulator Cst2 n=1 Tax=Aphanothece sacrum FPU1 TaxID=1920663 RepID=A0A401INM3_APHSA|nr:type I-B CRISPR-associated protein Cas7/Cst2/DevR [Aphanothece sacrum]GBF82865.1 CRISPR-associated autoregulator Cst2 [Aphanothece sacrum FPU1]GBF86258.1 CRISPR-associated autoregulator, Cst2 family [Aphanothece sacrum FPU3]
MTESKTNLNLFVCVLTYPAPTGNYRGESEENRTILQKIIKQGQKYAVISPESMRNALRETLILLNQPNNRTRIHDEDQLAVEFKEYPNAQKYADDFLFGYMVAQTNDVKKMRELNLSPKRDSIFRCNLAVALSPYKYDAIFHQSPLNAKTKNNEKTYWKNASTSALLHREVTHTAFQYPFALSQRDCLEKPEWIRALLQAIAQLNGVAGGHARAYYEFAPRSVVARLTPKLVAGYKTYGFEEDGSFPELNRLGKRDLDDCDLPGDEFWIGGEIVRQMDENELLNLTEAGVHLFKNPDQLFDAIADEFLGGVKNVSAA